MNNINKYIKATKKIVLKPEREDIEDKILKRISNIKEEDRKLLDEKFLDYLKKSNSRLYMLNEKILNNPGKFALIVISIAAFIGFSAYFVVNLLKGGDVKDGNN